jgi:hypothetical protein
MTAFMGSVTLSFVRGLVRQYLLRPASRSRLHMVVALRSRMDSESCLGVLMIPEVISTDIPMDTNFVSHYYPDMKNVTITLDEEVARWARIRAAERDTSLSRLIGEMVRERMLDEAEYQTSMDNYFAPSPRKLKKEGEKYPGREELHERQDLR